MTQREGEAFLRAALDLARGNIARGGRPFGAVIVKDGAILASGVNDIVATHDPTAHAEMEALRAASHALGSPDLSDCTVYASGHPCPMCLAAMRMSGISAVTYAYSNADAEPFGLSTAAIYADLQRAFAEQSMAIRHDPIVDPVEPALYLEWQRRQRQDPA